MQLQARVYFLLAILTAAGAGWLLFRHPLTTPATPKVDPATAAPALAGGATPVPATAPKAVERPVPRTPEQLELTGFYELDAAARIARVTAWQKDPELPAITVAVLKHVVADRELPELVRNNAANALVLQRQHDPLLAETFAAMMEDPAEPYAWREYAIQHTASAAAFARNLPAIVDRLEEVLRQGPQSMPGTALLQLDRLSVQGLVSLDQRFDAELLRLLSQPGTDLRTTVSALGIVGEHSLQAARPRVRELASSPLPAIRRSAIAALGSVGDASDRALISAACTDPDRSLHPAALAALAKLDHRLAPER